MVKLIQALRPRIPLLILVLLNVGAALLLGLDLYHELATAPTTGAPIAAPTALLATPTMVPAPTRRPTATPTPPPPSPTPTVTPTPLPFNLSAVLVDDWRFAYEPGFYAAEIQAFLESQDSVLAGTSVPVGKGSSSFAQALSAHCIRYSLNPKVVLALIELQSGLVRSGQASAEKLRWALAYRSEQWEGLDQQLQWATYRLADGFRLDEPLAPLLTDGTAAPIPGEANAATRSLLHLLAYTADAKLFDLQRAGGPGSFVAVYRELFGKDPRMPPDWPAEVERSPFLYPAYQGAPLISSYFDHEYPIFHKNGSLVSFTGERGYGSYDGHDGWDYVLDAGTPVLAAAAGRVVFAGAVDTLCATPANLVVIDHGEGYRTLYWHLQRVEAREGSEVAQGERIGTVGSTGCSTGPHLHLGVQFLGRDIDPYGWCGSEAMPEDPWATQPAGIASRWLWADRPSPCPVPAAAIVVDGGDSGFTKSPALWYEAPVGYGGRSFWAIAVDNSLEVTHRVVWRPELPEAGRYFLYVQIPWYDTGRPDAEQVQYKVRHSSGETTVTVDQAHSAGLWAPLGAFYFGQGSRGYVYLDETASSPGTTVWFDAVVWVKE